VLKLPDWCWGSAIKRDAQVSTHRMTEMTDRPFQYAQEHMVGIFEICLVLDVDYVLAKAENLSLGRVSMVSENLQRMENLDRASKLIFKDALKNAATTSIAGSSPFYKGCCAL
jgi:hypothetical protein